MGMELIYSQNNSAVPLMKKICCGALMLKTSPTAGGASDPAVDTCRLCGNACCRPEAEPYLPRSAVSTVPRQSLIKNSCVV